MKIIKKIASFFQKGPIYVLTDNGLIFLINEKEKTASLEADKKARGDVIIPRSIIHESEEFIVTKVSHNSFEYSINIDSIIFPEDSEVQIIEEEAFSNCTAKSIILPPKLNEISRLTFYYTKYLQNISFPKNCILKKICNDAFLESNIGSLYIPENTELMNQWCIGTHCLNNITISPKNKFYINYQNQFIIGKTNKTSENFDYIVFSPRNIKIVTIPSFIKKIAPFTFEHCYKLKYVDFELASPPSEIIIEESAFIHSSINFISIPSYVVQIGSDAFSSCKRLTKVEFMPESKLQEIEKFTFSYSGIQSISIPPSVKIIRKKSFKSCSKLKKIYFCKNSKLQLIEDLAFEHSAIVSIQIPSSVKKIGLNSFYLCKDLQIIEISRNTKLDLNLDLSENNDLRVVIMISNSF